MQIKGISLYYHREKFFYLNPEKRNKTLCKNEMNIICIMFEETK